VYAEPAAVQVQDDGECVALAKGGWMVAALWHGVVLPGVTRHACLGEIKSRTGMHGLIDSLGKAVDVKYSV
jgi:hypothetical protein